MRDISDCPLVHCFKAGEWIRVDDIAQLEANDIIKMVDRKTGCPIPFAGTNTLTAVRQGPVIQRRVLMPREYQELVIHSADRTTDSLVPLPTSIGSA